MMVKLTFIWRITDELIEQVEDIARASNLNESDEYYVDVNDISVLIERRRQ